MKSRKVAQEKFTDAQRAAAASAYEDRRIRPARRVAEMAAAGELIPGEPFQITPDYVTRLAASLRRRRAGQASSELAKLPPRDAVEAVRRRLAAALDHELDLAERLQRQRGADRAKVIDRLRQIGRAARELAAIPGPNDPRPPAPGQRNRGAAPGEPTHNDGATRSGLAKQLLDAVRDRATGDVATPTETPHKNPPHNTTTQEKPERPHTTTHTTTDNADTTDNAERDSWLRARVTELMRDVETGGGGGVEG